MLFLPCDSGDKTFQLRLAAGLKNPPLYKLTGASRSVYWLSKLVFKTL